MQYFFFNSSLSLPWRAFEWYSRNVTLVWHFRNTHCFKCKILVFVFLMWTCGVYLICLGHSSVASKCKCTHVHSYMGKCVKPKEKVLKAKHTSSPLPIKLGRSLTILLNQAGWHGCVLDALRTITYMLHFKVMNNLTVFSVTGTIQT